MARPAVAIALPKDEYGPVAAELADAGFEPVAVTFPEQLEALLADKRDVAVAIIDGETNFDTSLEFYSLLRDEGRKIPALLIVSQRTLERLETTGSIDDEYLTRPYSPDSLRWRVEAMCIRSQVVDDGSGPVIQSGQYAAGDWTRRATVVAVFNPKGGVGKTTVATNLAAALQVRNSQHVLLIDADTVTGHVTTSLGLEQVRTLVDSLRDEAEGGPSETLIDIAAEHPSGVRVVALTSSPSNVEVLDPDRLAEAINLSRRGFDYIVVDLHPSYSPLNQAVFEVADRILVPVTPDVPAIRAAVQLRELADEAGLSDRLAMVVNRAKSGVSVEDMEKTVGMPALALIRSGGMLFVRAANEGRTLIDRFPKERVTEDFGALADRLMPTPTIKRVPEKSFLESLFGRKTPVRA